MLEEQSGLIKRNHTALMGSRSQATAFYVCLSVGGDMTLPIFFPPGFSLMIDIFSFSEFLHQEKRRDSERGLDQFSVSHDMDDVHRNCVLKVVWFDIHDKALSSITLPMCSGPGVLFSILEGQCVLMGPESPCTVPPPRFSPALPFMNQSWSLLSCSHILVLQK